MKESTVDWTDRTKSFKQQCHEQRVAEEKYFKLKTEEDKERKGKDNG